MKKGWAPSAKFFALSETVYEDERTQTPNSITWRFEKFTIENFPICYFKCSMSGFGHATAGFGVASTNDEAMTKAFCEAWERLWYYRLKSGLIEGLRPTSTNGFAAGVNVADAGVRAKHELVERAALLTAWHTMVGWRLVNIHGLKNKFRSLSLRAHQWRQSMYHIDTDLGSVACLLALHPQNGARFDSTFLGEIRASHESLLNSIMKSISFTKSITSFTLPLDAEPSDHHKFYSVVSNCEAFGFLKTAGVKTGIIELGAPKDLRIHVLCEESAFPAVALATNPSWPVLKWGLSSIGGINKWPHPLA